MSVLSIARNSDPSSWEKPKAGYLGLVVVDLTSADIFMKPKHKSDSQLNNFFAKKQQPRRWMLAVMLTGVIIFKAYPSLIQIFLKDTYNLLATSITQVAQMAAAFNILSPDSASVASKEKLISGDRCKANSDCDPVQHSVETLDPSPMYVAKLPLSERISYQFQLTGFNLNLPPFQSPQANAALPSQVIDAIRQDLAKKLGKPPQQLNVVQATSRNWPDTCLGLAKAGEFCGQQMISGWRVVVSAANQTWIYRSDGTGKLLRLESQQPTSKAVPPSIINLVFQKATKPSGLPDSVFKMTETQPNIWPDSCLGLAQQNDLCTQTLVPGWQITLSSGWEQWVYRTDQTGSMVQLDFAASSKASAQPLLAYHSGDDSLLSRATQHSIWNAIAQNSIADNTYNTLVKNHRDY